MSSSVVTIKKQTQFPKRVSITSSKEIMNNGQSSAQEHPKEEKDRRPSSILSTGSRQLKKNVSFSDWNSVYLIPKKPADRTQQCGYILDVKQTYTNLLDTKTLSEVDEDSEVELTTVCCDLGLDGGGKPHEFQQSTETNSDIIVCRSSQATAFVGRPDEFPDGGPRKPSRRSAERASVSFRSGTVDSYEEPMGRRLERKAAEDSIKEKRWQRLKAVLSRTNVKSGVNRQEELAGDIGGRTCEAIKDYIVGLSERTSSGAFGAVDLVPVYVAVKGTLSKKVIRKESTTKNKRGLDLVGTHTLKNRNINCAIRFYYDKNAKEIAESRVLRR